MKMLKKSILIFGAFIMLVLTSIPSLAVTETDGTNDVFHGMTMSSGPYYYTDEKDNIDITSIAYEVNNNNITLTMTVDGVVEESEFIVYYVYYTSAEATYLMMYANGSGIFYCQEDPATGADAVVTKTSEDTLTGVIPLYGTDTSKVDLYGTAYQYTSASDPNAEYWVDWNPNAHTGAPAAAAQEEDDSGDTDSGDDNKGSPGFEAIVLIAAIAVALIILRRKK